MDNGEGRFQAMKLNQWDEVIGLGARLACHDNTRKSVEEILRLVIGKEAIKLLLLEELRRPEMTAEGKVTFEKNYEGTKRLLQEICSTQIKEAADRAEIHRKHGDYLWLRKLAYMSAELDRVETTEDKEAIEEGIKKEREDQEWKKKMWEAIQRAREERIEKDNAELCEKLTKSTGLRFDPACAAYNKVDDVREDPIEEGSAGLRRGLTKATGLKFFANLAQVGDAIVSRVKRPLLKGEIGVEEPKNRSCKCISVSFLVV